MSVPNEYIDTGNCSISNDPETSILDRWCHDVDNLNVVDGGPSRPGNDRKFEGDHCAPVPVMARQESYRAPIRYPQVDRDHQAADTGRAY